MAVPAFEYTDNEDGSKTVTLDGVNISKLVSSVVIEADHATSEVILELVASVRLRHTTFFGRPYVDLEGSRYCLQKVEG